MVKLKTIKEHLLEDFVCCFCLRVPDDIPQILGCGCIFCNECILNYLKLSINNQKCPKCTALLSKERVRPAPALLIRILNRIKKISNLEYSSKFKLRNELISIDLDNKEADGKEDEPKNENIILSDDD